MHGTPRYVFLCAFLCVRSHLSPLHSRLLALFAGAWGPRRAWPSRRRRGCCARPAGRREAYAGAIAHDAPAGPRARPSVRARRPPPRPLPSLPPVPRSPTRARVERAAVSSATRARWAAAQVARGRRHRLFRASACIRRCQCLCGAVCISYYLHFYINRCKLCNSRFWLIHTLRFNFRSFHYPQVNGLDSGHHR